MLAATPACLLKRPAGVNCIRVAVGLPFPVIIGSSRDRPGAALGNPHPIAARADARATTWFLCGDRKPHCWSGPLTPAERLKEMAQFIAAKKPEGATTLWWP